MELLRVLGERKLVSEDSLRTDALLLEEQKALTMRYASDLEAARRDVQRLEALVYQIRTQDGAAAASLADRDQEVRALAAKVHAQEQTIRDLERAKRPSSYETVTKF